MKIVIPGGSGHVGRVLVPALRERGHEVIVLSRDPRGRPGRIAWDGRNQGDWAREIDGADAVINLAGRSVDCRYHKDNLTEMLASRIDSVRAVGAAIEAAANPPPVWIQASTATIYAHRFDAPNDEETGILGGDESDAPAYWRFSIEIAKAWERELAAANTPATRRVALRMAIVLSAVRGATFDILFGITRLGLGGPIAGGAQYVSWVHDRDLVRAVEWVLAHDELEGPVNVAAPEPLPHREFMRVLRDAMGVPFGVGATRWMFELAAVLHRTDPELLLKSRRVISGRLVDSGFTFDFPDWASAAADLVARRRASAERRAG